MENGHDFQQAGQVLFILIFGQIINILAGSVGTLLVMTGHERDVVISVSISTIILFALGAVFIPMWGVFGAAYATVGGLIVLNIVLTIQVNRRLGIDPTVLGLLSRH